MIRRKGIGLIGGIFDPVHYGHLASAQLAYEFFHLRKIFFIPAGIPPHKPSSVVASAKQRVVMLQKALGKNSAFSLWDGELKRNGVSYTIDTLKEFKLLFPTEELYFIIGSDNIIELLTWRDYKSICEIAVIGVSQRPGYSMAIPQQLRHCRIIEFPSAHWALSSTLIRNYLKQNYCCNYFMPLEVAAYIKRHKLYR